MDDWLVENVVERITQEALVRELITISKKLSNKTPNQDFEKMVNRVIDKFEKRLSPHIIIALRFSSSDKDRLHERDVLAQQRIKMWYEARPDLVNRAVDQIAEFVIDVRKKFLEENPEERFN